MKTYAIAVSGNKKFYAVKRGSYYSIVNREEGIKPNQKWLSEKKIEHYIKAGKMLRFKEPIEYVGNDKVEKGGRKATQSVGLVINKNKKLTITPEIQAGLKALSLQNFIDDLTKDVSHVSKSVELIIKADNGHLPVGASRHSYTCSENYNIVYIPVNRLKRVYQTELAENPATVNRKCKDMLSGKPMPPVEIGYNYDVHDGHHSWQAAIKAGYNHVPCKVVGSDPEKIKSALEEYKKVWKSLREELWQPKPKKKVDSPNLILSENSRLNPTEDVEEWKDRVEENDTKFRSKLGVEKSTELVIDLVKSLNRGKLIKRRVAVQGKGGKTFFRMQWVRPDEANGKDHHHPGVDHSTYSHHEDGIKEMEKRRSNRFPVMHHPTDELKHVEHNYRTDKEKYAQAKEAYDKGEQLPPVHINDKGEILDHDYIVDLAKDLKLSHVPVIVSGNPMLKKEKENQLKRHMQADQDEVSTTGAKDKFNGSAHAPSSETVGNLQEFENFIKVKYTKDYLMAQAEKQGIVFNKKTKDGRDLPANSPILWMRAHTAIKKHIQDGNRFEVEHDEKIVDKKIKESNQDSIQKHFLKLLEKRGSKSALMEWALDNGISWKEHTDPSINWMRASMAVKKELAKGKMLDGVRTRQKEAIKESTTRITDDIKDMVTAYGKHHGKAKVMDRADALGIEYNKVTKKGATLPMNSPILWMNAHSAIAKHIAQGGEFKMEGETNQGLVAATGDYGDAKLSQHQEIAVDLAKRNSAKEEARTKSWAIKALSLDRGIGEEEAETLYNQFMEKSRNARFMVHFDPMEQLKGGVTLIEQLSAEGHMKNDYEIGRNIDVEYKQGNEYDMFGDDYDSANNSERPVYGIMDLHNQGLAANSLGGSVALVLKDEVKRRGTGSAVDSSSIPYGEEGKWLRSLQDPHHMIVDRWKSKWRTPNKADKQRERAMSAVIEGSATKDDHYYESHIHGQLDLAKDVDHILVPDHWKTDKAHKDKHESILNLARQHGLEVKYDGSTVPDRKSTPNATANEIFGG
ncbi:hypothetical protein EalM132_00044 [Exiguobacterium phage vB_EalM-132]|nr:hypothetical protein EalM132_00044 [Exiguobacterium phage vB_EalM-132]